MLSALIIAALVVGAAIVAGGLGLFHTSIYTGSFAAAGTDADLPAAQDPAVTLVNGHPIFTTPVKAMLAYGVGATTLNRLRLSTPKIRAFNVPYFRPLDIAAAPSSRTPLVEWFRAPLNLNAVDENQLLITQAAAAATQFYGAVWFGDGNMGIQGGDQLTIRLTGTVTFVANTWVAATLTLDQPLPAGEYMVIGMDAWATNLLFARIIFPRSMNGQQWRPGIVAGGAESFVVSRYFRWGNLGEFGRFVTQAIPQIDFFASAAGAQACQVFLDIVRIS